MPVRRIVVLLPLILLTGCTWPSNDGEPRVLVYRGSDEDASSQLYPPDDVNKRLSDPPKLLSDAQLQDGWIALFDGQTLFGWTANSETDWSVVDGAIVSKPGTPGLLLTTTGFQDYELKCDVWLEQGGNSGLFLRTVTHPAGAVDGCLEFNLCDSHAEFPTGSLVARVKASESVTVEGDWHAVELVVQGEQILAKIDEKTVLDMTSPDFVKTGGDRIGLQQNGGEVRFRNVFLKPLGLEPLFDGTSHAGWKPVPGSKGEISATGETIHITGGPGFLETEREFDDFVLQFEAKLNAKDVNSGLFFRAMKGTEETPSNGYELQLQNTVTDGDRTKPADYGDGFGTGAIFRRQAARYVNASDEKWFAVTLVAERNHFASWVNGLQVTDFVDERKPNPNPRQGRRDEAGHLSFQGHDPKTDASFRNVRIEKRTE
ncbi:MAG: DUF1080 domain-containing protein [Planctomycetaceae bacterium]